MSSKEIYGIPNSGWTSPDWNWGYGVGTGHDCAAICRRMYSKRAARETLLSQLLRGEGPRSFEEVKLILALAWQRGRWDGSDGGLGGYSDVLSEMANAQRYEIGSEEECSRWLVQDMQSRFHLLEPEEEDMEAMQMVILEMEQGMDSARRKCAGLVLKAMGFVENGL